MTTAIAPEDFAFLSALVLREAAIVLEKGKEYLASSRLEPVARQEGLDGIPGLVRALRTNPHGRLRDQVVDAMTTNETLWFRDSHPFESLQKSILPEIVAARATTRSLDIWCAAASTGQEPYSIAMVLKEMPQLAGWRTRILATDISPSALDKARAGVYSQMEIGRGLPAKHMIKYFTRQGVDFQISQELRSMVEFRSFNLASNWPPMGTFDLVFIRNVLIYFSQDTKAQIINKAERLVRPDGYLLLGATESMLSIQNNFERVQHGKSTCYRPKKA